jgi:hypothetical protein
MQHHVPQNLLTLKVYMFTICFGQYGKTHSKEEHNIPTITHKRIEGACILINNRRQQLPQQKILTRDDGHID